MCFDTHTEAGRVQKNPTSLEFLKAAAGYYFVIEREYKKRSKAGCKRSQSNIMHISRKFLFNFSFSFCMCGTGLVSYKFHDYIVPEVSIRASPESTVYMSLLSYFVNCFSMVHVYTVRSIGRASTEVKFTVFALPVFSQVQEFVSADATWFPLRFQCFLLQ